jgi:predicted  nucleic acid-binding Zn-ribbon protein
VCVVVSGCFGSRVPHFSCVVCVYLLPSSPSLTSSSHLLLPPPFFPSSLPSRPINPCPDQQWQPWKIQKQSISKLEHEIKQYETSKQTAHDNWDVEHQKTITLGEKLGHINALSKKTHALTNHIKNMKGIMIQVEKCEEQMPKTTSSSSSSSVSSMAINADMNEYTSLEGIEVGLEKVEKERNEIGDRLVELDRALDEGMRKIKNLQDSLSNARKQKQSHSERIQKLMALKASVTDMEKRIKSLTEQVTDHEKELKKCQREEISCKADLEAKETELDGALEEVKVLYSACHESCLEYDNSHKQLEKDAAKGSIAKLNKCDSDIAKSEEEKKEIDKYIVKQQPNIRAMRDRQNQAGAMKKTVVDNITSRVRSSCWNSVGILILLDLLLSVHCFSSFYLSFLSCLWTVRLSETDRKCVHCFGYFFCFFFRNCNRNWTSWRLPLRPKRTTTNN